MLELNPFLTTIFLGLLPISEVRGVVVYALSIQQPWLIAVGALANIAVAPLLLMFWDLVNVPWWGRRILGARLDKKIRDFTARHERLGGATLIIFIGIPFPLTGVYTGTLVGRLVGIKRKWVLFAAVAGVVIAAAITYIIFVNAVAVTQAVSALNQST